MTRLLRLRGTPYEIGRQHGQQVRDLRPAIIASMDMRVAQFREHKTDLSRYVNEITCVWRRHAAGTLEMLRGIVDALELDWEDCFSYLISAYVADQARSRRSVDRDEGCTTWAASGPFTADGAPVMAKNRDHHPDQRWLQCVAHVEPEGGHAYLCVTTAGTPGIASSGINASGLAVADTFVASRDVGAGVGRYSLMQSLLEHCSDVEDALRHARGFPHFGNGNVLIADASGDMAVFEIAHSRQAALRSHGGFIVSANHYTAPQTRPLCEPDADSVKRRARVDDELVGAKGTIDVAWAKNLMAQHGETSSAVCRHGHVDGEDVTISSVVFLPRMRTLHLSDGAPCENRFESFELEPS